jgi:cytochrome P450
MEAAIALPRVLRRFPDLELVPGGAPWRESMAMRGLSELLARRAGVRETHAGVVRGP